MTKQFYKYKLEFTCDGVTNISYHKNTASIKDKYGIPRSSLFLVISGNNPPDKYRHYKCYRVKEPVYETTERTIID